MQISTATISSCIVFSLILQVHSGVLFKAFNTVKCGLHKLGNKIHQHEHEHDVCNTTHSHHHGEDYPNPNAEIEEVGFLGPTGNSLGNEDNQVGRNNLNKTVPSGFEGESTTGYPQIDIRGNVEGGGTKNNTASGKRLINPGGNCDDGSLADNDGVCREEY